jgi:hypothetical protein
MNEKIIVVGSNEKVIENSVSKHCINCGRKVWFGDSWEWKKCSPSCMSCVIKKNGEKKFLITEESIERAEEEIEKLERINLKYVG